MNGSFEGKVAIITGGGSGIGRAVALALAEQGCKLVIANRNQKSGEATVQLVRDSSGDATFIKTDVTKSTEVESLMAQTVKQHGRLDFLFNGAGVQPAPGPTTDETEEAWNRSIDVDLKGTWLCTKFAIPHLLKSGGGSIVNTAGASGLVGFANWTSQCASKHGIVGLTKAVALEYAKEGIRVNAVCPGLIRTPMLEKLAGGAENVDGMAGVAPVGRIGNPDDIAQAVVWLCSDGSKLVTGHALSVDGGMVAQ